MWFRRSGFACAIDRFTSSRVSVRRKEVSIKKVKDKQSFSPCHSDVEMELLLLFAYVLSHGCEWGVKRARKRVSSFDPHKVHTH